MNHNFPSAIKISKTVILNGKFRISFHHSAEASQVGLIEMLQIILSYMYCHFDLSKLPPQFDI